MSTPIRVLHSLGKAFGRFDYSHEVNRAMQGCLACKACATQCPVKVDVPAFRSEFLQRYHTRYLRPLRDHLVAGLVDTPLLARRSLRGLLRARSLALLPAGAAPAPASDRRRVVIVQDAFM